MADAAYEFEFLEGLRLCFVLWEGDEEFPPLCPDPVFG